MKTIAEKIQSLKERKKVAREAFINAFEKESQSLAKRIGITSATYDECFNAYLHDQYPTDKDGNDKPYERPTSLSKLTLIYLYVQELPYIASKHDKWYALHKELAEVEKALK